MVIDTEAVFILKKHKTIPRNDPIKEARTSKTIKKSLTKEKLIHDGETTKPEIKPENTTEKPRPKMQPKIIIKKIKKPEEPTEIEVKLKDPMAEEQKLKKLKEIVKQGIEKHREIKTLEQQKKEVIENEKKKKQEMVKEIELKAKEALKEAKVKPYEPTTKWGVDERNFKELSKQEKQKIKEEKLLAEKTKKEYREKVKREGRARIGLEIVDIYPEILEKRGRSVEPIAEEKHPREKNPQIQEWIKKKKEEKKQTMMMEQLKQHEINMKRMHVLKELEIMSKPPRPASTANKNTEVIKKLKKKSQQLHKSRSNARSDSNYESNNSDFEFKGNFEFVNEESPSNSSLPSNVVINLSSDLKPKPLQEKKTDKNRLQAQEKKKKLSLDFTESFEELAQRPGVEISNYSGSNDIEIRGNITSEYPPQNSEGQSHDLEAEEEEGEEEEEEEEEEYDEDYYGSQDQFEEANSEEYVEGEESYEEEGEFQEESGEYFEENGEGEESIDESSEMDEDQQIEYQAHQNKNRIIQSSQAKKEETKSNGRIQKEVAVKKSEEIKSDYPGNSKIAPGFQKYSVHPYATMEKSHLIPVPLQQEPSPLLFPLSSTSPPEEKEKIRTKLADLQKRVSSPQKSDKPAAIHIDHYEKFEVDDDFDVKCYKLPGVILTGETYALSKIFSDVEVYRAASKIQGLVRGYLTRKNIFRIQCGVPSDKQISNDIHGLLLKYYPEAYVPDFFGSSCIPESISLVKSSMPANPVGVHTIAVNTDPQQFPNKPLRFEPKDFDEYNLIDILAKENLLIQPETSLDANSYHTEEVYSEEFDSISEDVRSDTGRNNKYSSRISESIKESISGSKYIERTHRSKYQTDSIKESLEEFKDSSIKESISASKPNEKRSKNKWLSGSIQESIPETYSSKFDSIQESINERSVKRGTSSSNYNYPTKRSEIPEEIDDFKRNSSVRFAEDPISEKISEQGYRADSKRSAEYEDDFESASSVSSHSEKLMSKFTKAVISGRSVPALSAQKLEEQFLTGLEALDRVNERELQIDAIINEKKIRIEEEFRKQVERAQIQQSLAIQEMKGEEFNRFQIFMQEMMRQQKECFLEISETIGRSLKGVLVKKEAFSEDESSEERRKIRENEREKEKKKREREREKEKERREPVVAAKKNILEDNRVKITQNTNEKVLVAGSLGSMEKRKALVPPIKSNRKISEESIEDSIEEDIEGHIYSNPSHSSGRTESKPSEYTPESSREIQNEKIIRNIKSSEESIEEIYESQFESASATTSSKLPIPYKPEIVLKSPSKPPPKSPEESSVSEIYESQFESYSATTSSKLPLPIKPDLQIKPLSDPIKQSSESSVSEIYESQFESYSATTSSKLPAPLKPDFPIKPEVQPLPISPKSSSISEIYESQFESCSPTSSSRLLVPTPLVPQSILPVKSMKTPDSSESEVYESQFESYHESSTSKAIVPNLRLNTESSGKSIQESIQESIEEIIESKSEKSLPDEAQGTSIKSSSNKLPAVVIKSSSDEIYESNFESYHESGSVKIPPTKKPEPSSPIFVSEDSYEAPKQDIPKLALPLKSMDPEIRYSQHKSSDLSDTMQEDIQENIYSDDFESERSEKRSSPGSHRLLSAKNSGNYRANLTNFNTKFPSADSFSSSSQNSPAKISARSNRKSPDLRSSTSSISEDLDIYDSFSKQSATLENSVRRSLSLVESSKHGKPSESIGESGYSDDFESDSRSFRPTHSYGSELDSVGQADAKNFKTLHASIKEVSPEESNSESISESVRTDNHGFSGDYESETNSKKLLSNYSESREAESAEKKALMDIPEEEKGCEVELTVVDEVTEVLWEMLREDALLLLADRDLNEIVEELFRRLVEDGLRLVPAQKMYANNMSFLARTVKNFVEGLPEDGAPPGTEKVLQCYRNGATVKTPQHKGFQEFVPGNAEHKKVFRAVNRAIEDTINQLHTSWNASLLIPMKPQYSKTEIQKKVEKIINQKMGCLRPCINQEERRQLEIQRENCTKEVIYQEIEEEERGWINLEVKGLPGIEVLELNLATEAESQILDLLISEIQDIMS